MGCYVVGTVAIVTCNEGYTAGEPITCGVRGNWSDEGLPDCHSELLHGVIIILYTM